MVGVTKTDYVRRAVIFIILLSLVFVFPTQVEAVIIDEDGQINAGETINDDVFLSGKTIVVDGTVNGALFVSGESININGVVNGDLFVAGRTINLSDKSAVGGNLFIGGQNIVVNGKVNGSVFIGGASADIGPSSNIMRNVFFGGFSLNVIQGSRTGRDMLIGGYQAIIKGEVARDLKIGAAALELNGKVGGDLVAEIGDSEEGSTAWMSVWGRAYGLPDPIQPGLRIGSESKINGKITYTAPRDLRDNIKAQPGGGIAYQTPEPSPDKVSPKTQVSPITAVFNWIFDRIRLIITLLVIGGLVIWLVPKYLNQAVLKVKSQLVPALWKGALTVVGGYLLLGVAFAVLFLLVVILAVFTLGDLSSSVLGFGSASLGVIATGFGFLVSYVSKIIIAFLVGELIFIKLFPKHTGNKIWPMLIGILIYVLIRSIPVLGWLVGVAATLIGVGALWLLSEPFRKNLRPKAVNPGAVT